MKKVKKGKIKRSVQQEETIIKAINESEGIHVSDETKERTLHKTDE